MAKQNAFDFSDEVYQELIKIESALANECYEMDKEEEKENNDNQEKDEDENDQNDNQYRNRHSHM